MPSVDHNSISSALFPHREKELQQIAGVFGHPKQWTVPCVFVYGQKSCGKSAILSHILSSRKLPHVLLNCIECYAQSLVFENILRGISLSAAAANSNQAEQPSFKCDNGNDFIRHLKLQLQNNFEEETYYVVLDKAEYLRDLDDLLLPVLVNLQALSKCNICVVMVSELPWDKFYCNSNMAIRRPLMVFFSDYTQTQLQDILCHLRPDGVESNFYRQYLHILLVVFSLACRDLRELQYLAHKNYSAYCEPIEEGKLDKDNHPRLWKSIEPRLKLALQNIYFRASSMSVEGLQTDEGDASWSSQAKIKKSSLVVELPFYTKFLLIAGYLASFNPQSSDKRFFVKNAGRMRKKVRNATVIKSNKTNCHLEGPHAFSLNRLMAIFYAVVDSRVPPTMNLFSQVTNLVSLQLLTRISREDEIDSPKYKCLASIDSVSAISKTVNFELLKYLYDLV